MDVKKILKDSQYLFTALAVNVWVNGAFYHESGSIHHSVAFAQLGNDCPSIEAPSFEPLLADANNDASIQNLISSCIKTAYETYSSSLDINFVEPLAQIANEAPERRDESFVTDTASLNIKQMIEDFEYLQSLVESALDINAVQASVLITELDAIQDELSTIEDVIITPLLSSGQNINRLDQIFVYKGEGEPEIENIQKSISLVDITSAAQGDYGPETFAGIEQFLENHNSAIENSLKEDTILPSEDNITSRPPESFRNLLWLGVIVLSLILLVLRIVIKRQNASRQPTSGINEGGDRPLIRDGSPVAPQQTPEPYESQQSTAVLNILEASATAQDNYSSSKPTPVSRSEAPEEITKVKQSDTSDELPPRRSAEQKPTLPYQSLLEIKDTDIRPVRNKKRKTQLKFSFSESELVSEYNRNFRGLEPGAHAVEQTVESATGFHRGYNSRIELEAKPTGKYWRIHIEERKIHYLVPVKDSQFNALNRDALGACFHLQNKGVSNEFELVKPAIVKSIMGKSTWRLVKKGEIRFLTH